MHFCGVHWTCLYNDIFVMSGDSGSINLLHMKPDSCIRLLSVAGVCVAEVDCFPVHTTQCLSSDCQNLQLHRASGDCN